MLFSDGMIIHVQRFGVPLDYILRQLVVSIPGIRDALSPKRFSGVRLSGVLSPFLGETLKYIKSHPFLVADFFVTR